MDPEKKSLNFIFPTKYVIPKSLKFSHWLSEILVGGFNPFEKYATVKMGSSSPNRGENSKIFETTT